MGFLVVTLKLPLASLDEMTFEEFGWLYEYHYEEQKEQYEILAHVISVGYARTQTKKKIKLFDERKTSNKKTMTKMTAEEKESQLKSLFEKFN